MGILLIVNENDVVSVDEMDYKMKFGDNDCFFVVVVKIIKVDLLIMLLDIDGFFDKNFNIYDDVVLCSYVFEIIDDIIKLVGGVGSKFGIGGMFSKIKSV